MRKSQKILLTLFRLSKNRHRAGPYEDLVVAAYKAYPEDFSLRGYPQYPDASDIHKPIYNQLKPRGLVLVTNKTLKLTNKGKDVARRIEAPKEAEADSYRLTRAESQAVQRHLRSSAVDIVTSGRAEELIDTDCQWLYGFAAWTKPRDAVALREQDMHLVNKLKRTDLGTAEVLERTDKELQRRFRDLFEERGIGNLV